MRICIRMQKHMMHNIYIYMHMHIHEHKHMIIHVYTCMYIVHINTYVLARIYTS